MKRIAIFLNHLVYSTCSIISTVDKRISIVSILEYQVENVEKVLHISVGNLADIQMTWYFNSSKCQELKNLWCNEISRPAPNDCMLL